METDEADQTIGPVIDLSSPMTLLTTELERVFEDGATQENASMGCFTGPSTLLGPHYQPSLSTRHHETASIPGSTSTNLHTATAMHIIYLRSPLASLVVARQPTIWSCVEPDDTLRLEEMIRKELQLWRLS